jgi:hypothetical protein
LVLQTLYASVQGNARAKKREWGSLWGGFWDSIGNVNEENTKKKKRKEKKKGRKAPEGELFTVSVIADLQHVLEKQQKHGKERSKITKVPRMHTGLTIVLNPTS